MRAPLIILPGALGSFEGSDLAARLLAKDRAVRIFDYANDESLEAMLARLERLIGEEGGSTDLLGQSYGGWIAQCAARRFPQRIHKLVLSHSFRLERGSAWQFRLAAALFRAIPQWLWVGLLERRVASALAPVAHADPALYTAQMRALGSKLRSSEFSDALIAQQHCMVESLSGAFRHLPPVPADLPVMIIESANDPLIDARAQARLRAAYPSAEVVRFESAGHVSAMVESLAYHRSISEFLDPPS